MKKFLVLASCVMMLLAVGCSERNKPEEPKSNTGTVADPQWVVTVETDLNSSMTVVAKVTLGDNNGTLAAFIGDDCCGVAKAQDEDGLYLLFISPSESGNTITFKFYSPAQKHIYTANETMTYVADGHEGTVAAPFTPTWTVTD